MQNVEKYKEYKRKHGMETYRLRKEHGTCTRCGKEDALPNRICCLKCSIDQTERAKRYYHRKKAENDQ